jgi:ubiquitin-protein ligase
MSRKNRLKKEILEDLLENKEFQITIFEDISVCEAIKAKFFSVDDSPYASIPIEVLISVPKNYPFSPCLVTFTPIIMHPNVTSTGVLDYPLFKQDMWSPVTRIQTMLIQIKALFHTPFFCEDIPFVSDKGKEEDDGTGVEKICANPEALRLWQEEPGTLREIVLSQVV